MLTPIWIFILEYFPACNTLDSFLAILTQEGSIAFVLLNVVIYFLGKCYKCLLCPLEEFEVYLKPLYSVHLGQLNWVHLTPPVQRRQWHPTPVLFLGKSHGRRSLVGCSPWGREESDMTEWLHFSFFGSFFITNSVSVLVINLFMFSISSWFSLSRFLRIYPCLVGCPVSVQSLSRVRLYVTP